MKKLLVLALVVFGLAACQTEPQFDVQMGGEQEVMLTVSLPEATRASSADGFDLSTLTTSNYTLRYILEVYRVVNATTNELTTTCQRFVKTSDDLTMVFPVRLAPGYQYQVVAWADIVEGDSEADRYYDTDSENGLKAVSIVDGTWNAMDETRDAYTATQTISTDNLVNGVELKLKRPFAKLRVVATDITDIRKVGLEPKTATVVYAQDMYRSFNAVTGEASVPAAKSHAISYPDPTTPVYNDATGELTLFADYFFVPSTGTAKFTLTVNAAAGVIKENNFNTEISVERNKLTTIKGDVLTVGGNVEVKVENGLGELETINYADNAETLHEIINEAPVGEQTNITLGGNIDLGDLLSAGTLSTRAAATLPIVIPEGKVVALDLNGYKITTPFVEDSTTNHAYAFENHGSLTIQDSKGNGKIIARGNFNYGIMTLESGTIVACDGNGGYGVRNYAGAKFVMNGGSIVTSNEDGDDRVSGNYDATPIRVDEGATATITNGTITNICNYTSAIENHGTTTINGGSFTSVHSTVTNYGTMTINGPETTIKCDGEYTSAHPIYTYGESSTTYINGGNFIANDKSSCYYVSVNNSTVYISGGKFTNAGQAAFTGEGTIVVTGGQFDKDPSARVADGYKADEANGVWTVRVLPVAKIGETEYATLEEAVAAAKAGNTITILRNATLSAALTLPANITLNGNGKEINGNTITVDGNLTIIGDTNIKTLKAVKGGTITIKDGKTLALNNFSFGSKDTANAEYVIEGGTITANYGFFQHGKYTLRSNFETGYMYYSYGSDITVYGTFHSQGKGDGLDYVRGKLTIAKGGKSIHDKSLWVGQPASWGEMNASLVIEEGGYVQANSLSVYEGSSLTYSNDADLKYNSVTGDEYITKK